MCPMTLSALSVVGLFLVFFVIISGKNMLWFVEIVKML